MVMCSSKVAGYTRFLLDSFTDSDVDSISHEISQLVDDGVEISIPVLKTCLDCFTLRRSHPNASLLVKVLSFVFKRILTMSNPATLFSNALQDVDVSEEFVNDFTTSLDFSVSDKISFALSLTDFERSDAKSSGRNLLLAEIEQLCATTGHIEPTEQIQNVLSFLRKSEDLSSHLDSFILFLSSAQPRDGFSFPLTPILSHEVLEANVFRSMDFHSDSDENEIDVILAEIDKEIVVGDLMVELGCGFTADAQQCNQILSSFAPLNETTISRIIGNAARSYADLEDNHTTFSTFSLALGLCTPSELPAPRPWNVDILIATIKQLAPYTSWRKVIENLDHDGFYIPSMESFSFFMLLYKTACKEPFPLDAVCASVWKNTEGQLSFLKYAIAAPPEVFTFMHSSRKLVYIDNIMHSHEQQFGLPNQAWLSLDLLDVLCQLAERGHTVLVSSLLQYPLTHCPKTLLLGMTHIKTAYYLIQREVVSAVLPVIITNPQDSGLVVNLWHQNAELVLWGISNSQNLKADSILRIIDIAHELKILSIVLESVPVSFSIRLAVLASLRGFLDIENWLPNCLYLYKDHFAEECIKYVKNVHFSESEDFTSKYYHPSDPLTDLHLNATTSLLKALKANDSVITSSQLVEEIEKVNAAILNCNSKVQNGETKDLSASNAYGDDVEVEANAYFHQMFCGQLSVDAMVQMLSRYKDSLVQREKSIFECMIANLFEEYRFFHKYPERQLKIASILFGSVIKHQLISSITLGMALRLVLDSLRKPADSKMFLFGSKALEQFVNRLVELPQYCNHILQISHLRTTHPELVTVIEQALSRISSSNFEPDASLSHPGPSQSFPGNSELSCSGIGQSALQLPSHVQPEQKKELHIDDRQVPNVPSNEAKPLLPSSSNTSSDVSIIHKNPGISTSSTMGSFVRPARGVTSTRFGSALNIETLVAAAERRQNAIETPPPDVQDKISFIINNISTANIESKGKEFAEILPQQYYPWFAQYMVMKRASIEPNFHDLYLKFFEKVDSKLLFKEILQNTYENCKVLLGSELIKSSSEERSLLKNLGSWLGKLTIGRNYVLRGKEIDPKYLIVEAYEKGLMIAVIPFTSKVLEPCLNSIAYRPPNPWTMAILGLLAEIYLLPNLKMNLKFDIEVLFKNLGVDLKEVAPTSILNDRKREIDGNPDFSNKDLGVTHKSQPQMIPEPKTISPLKQIDLPLDVANLPNADAPSKLLSQYVAPQRVYTNTLTEDEKAATLGLSDQPPSPQGLFQSTPSTLFSMSQLSAALPNIGNHVVINQKLSGFGMHYPIQRVVPIAMDRAIREIVSGIVQRSVCIACQTTKELVLKDYALEPDETRIYNAAHLMVASLAGSLAHVTCKEPLRTSISTHLRNSLQGLNITNDAHPLEQIVQLVTNDNLDLGCAAIEQAVTEKAIQTIDADIDQQLLLRRKHRDGAGSSFLDPNMLAQNSVSSIPESLRPKPGHLSQSQQRVYEDFVQLPWQKQSTQSPHSLSAASSSSGDVGLGSVYGPVSGKIASDFLSSAGNARDDLVPRESDISVEGLESSAVSLLSSQVDPAGLELSKPTSTSELTLVESSGASIKETGTSLQTLTSATTMERLGGNNITHPSLSTRDALDKYQIVTQKVVYIAKIILASLYHVVDFLKFQMEDLVANNARDNEIQAVVSEVPEIILRCISRDEAALAVAQKAFKALYENASSNLHVSANLAILVVIRDVCKLVVKELTSWVIYSEEERKLNKDITIGLIQHELLNLAEYNVHMAKHLDGGRNKSATEFAVSLLQSLVNEESTVISELHSLVDALAKLSSKSGSPESLQQLIDIIRNPVANTNVLSDSATGNENNDRQSNDEKALCNTTTNTEENTNVDHVESDSAGFRNRVSTLFENWYQICEVSGANEIASSQYVLRLHQAGLLKGDETTESFFRILLELSVAHFISSEEISSGAVQSHQQAQSPSFLIIDIYAKLVFSILKCYPEQESSSKLFLLSEIIAVTVRSIQKDAENKTISPRPYFRLFINWLLDLSSLDPGSDGGNFQVLTAFANAFHALQPLKIPAFSFAWLELVSHRSFMPKLLTVNGQKGWPYVQRLLVDLLQFLEPFLRSAELGGPVNFLYKGTLRVLLVLLHDFPEFLCDYHFTFCDVIPSSCIQMRNIILSSFPRNMRLPDPSTPNLKIDLLPEIVEAPCILSEVDAALKAKQMKNDVDEYLTSRQQNSAFLSELAQKLLLSSSEASSAGTCYNVPLINSLVLYTGMQAIHQLQAGETQAQNVVALQIFKYLSMELDTEGRYLFLNAIANQLRYPNNHTHYFSFIMLYLFFESDQEIIQEQITRVLLERLIVNRPHPWGLLITFIELIKNPRYGFWKQGFIRCAPEIEKLFESVARSCGGLKPVDEGMVSGWVSDNAH